MVSESGAASPRQLLRDDLGREYFAIVEIISQFDQRAVIVKGWSVTLSLTSLGLGFQQGHFALFALGAATGLAFWFLDALFKRYQIKYYPRMRDIEYAAYVLNHLDIGDLRHASSPRIDTDWYFDGVEDRRSYPPKRRSKSATRRALRRCSYWPNVVFPHVVAVGVGLALFVAALVDLPGFTEMVP